jgi:hypothetical protein
MATASCLLAVFVLSAPLSAPAASKQSHVATKHRHHHHRRKKILKEGGWAGAGLAAGHAVGPAGSAAVGAAKYRRDLKAGGKRRAKAVAKIGGPIAAGAIAGPVGSVGYAAVEHRNWIKRHIFHMKPHRRHR